LPAALPAPELLPANPAAAVALAAAFPPSASRLTIIPLLPKLSLLVGEGASPIVQRIAAEICEKYGQS
jgi:hypothetical protein